MIRTLKFYLGKDLLRATALATVALTLVMTVFAVIEPLRERGLSSHQALKLFGFSMPVMVSLTLPIAALFAATIVYGRFGQDNELMAARASGICTLSLLTPAIWGGLIVSAITLGLGLYVAPRLLWRSQYTVKNNLRHIAFHGLRTQGYLEFSGRILHADRVDPDSGWMEGVVALDTSDPNDALYLVASRAKLDFFERNGETFVAFDPENWAARRQSGRSVLILQKERIQRGELPNPFEDEPKLYDWPKLCRVWAHPEESLLVQAEARKIKRRICTLMFYQDLAGAIKDSGKYVKLKELPAAGETGPASRIEVEAPWARLQAHEVVLTAKPPAAGGAPAGAVERPVRVRLFRGDRAEREYSAKEASVKAEWDEFSRASLVSLTLEDVIITDVGEPLPTPRAKEREEIGPHAVPRWIVADSEGIDLQDLRAHPGSYGLGQGVAGMTAALDSVTRRLLAKVAAEMHMRIAYGVSCMLMVMMGAALGLIFRGGQMLAAFAISAVPASLVIVMLFMGKELIKNPGVPEVYGIVALWSGIAALAAGTAYVYLVPMRR